MNIFQLMNKFIYWTVQEIDPDTGEIFNAYIAE